MLCYVTHSLTHTPFDFDIKESADLCVSSLSIHHKFIIICGSVHILKPYTFKSEFRTIVRSLVLLRALCSLFEDTRKFFGYWVRHRDAKSEEHEEHAPAIFPPAVLILGLPTQKIC